MATTRTVVWFGAAPPQGRLDAPGWRATLSDRGYSVEMCMAHDIGEGIVADARVVCGKSISATQQRVETGLDVERLPTLWLADDEAQEAAALERAFAGDEVARMPTDPSLLAARLDRLLAGRPSPFDPDRDALTGLPSGRGYDRLVRRALDELMPGDHRALVMVDLDRFKTVNDELGHAVGDRLLQAAAAALSRGLAPDDRVARLGGDEFVVLLSRIDAPTLLGDAEQLLRRIAEAPPMQGLGEVPTLSASGGLALLRKGLTASQLMQQAKTALSEAKRQGRGRLVHFELIHAGGVAGVEADLRRFDEVTRIFSERMTQMVGQMGRQLVEAARLQALQDPLTGARHRGFLDERLPREIERAQRGGWPLVMALLDIDHFHDVNVTYGWPSGDAVLQRVVAVASAQIRLTDWLARYGGEEFAIVLPDTAIEDAQGVLERVRALVEATEFTALDGRRVPVTVSIGAAPLVAGMTDALSLVDRASQACLRAKDDGRNRVVAWRAR